MTLFIVTTCRLCSSIRHKAFGSFLHCFDPSCITMDTFKSEPLFEKKFRLLTRVTTGDDALKERPYSFRGCRTGLAPPPPNAATS